MNPYEVLGVAENASQEEIRTAYRKLVKQYHPDQYQDNPLKELATEKLKEVNEAYEILTKKGNGGGQSQKNAAGGGQYSRPGGQQYSSRNPSLAQVTAALNRGDLRQAESLLMAIQNRNAEWHYLMGVLRLRQGNANMARSEFETATRMEPGNSAYRQAYESLMNSGRTYRPGTGSATINPCQVCSSIYLFSMCCQCMGGNRCC